MKYRQWFLLALSPLLLVVALVGVRSFGGSPDVASADVNTGTAHVEIDADPWDGSGPCGDVDNSATVIVGVPHDIAVCLTDAMAPAGGNGVAVFSMDVVYDPDLNSCVDKNCNKAMPCTEDDMPDLNEGSTLGLGVPTNPDMGGGWSCNGFGFTEPACAGGVARIECGTTSGPFPPTGPGIAFPLFVVTFTATHSGVDNMSLATVAVNDNTNASLGSCNPWNEFGGGPELTCIGAEVTKTGGEPPASTATPTATATATATATPCPDGICPTGTPTPKAWTKTPTPPPTGTPTPAEPGGPPPPPPPPPPPSGGTMPQVVPPATGSGPDGIPWASTAVWLLAAAGAVSASLGGLYLRRAGHR